MIYYVYMISVSYGKDSSCWRRDVKKLLIDKGYKFYNIARKYWKVNTKEKTVFACAVPLGKCYDEKTSFSLLEKLF